MKIINAHNENQRRKALSSKLRKESETVRENSMKILNNFDEIAYEV
jgi:hypothetical protein